MRARGLCSLWSAQRAIGQATRILANNLANMPIRNNGDCGTVWACWEATAVPQARCEATRNDGVLGSIPSVGSSFFPATPGFFACLASPPLPYQ